MLCYVMLCYVEKWLLMLYFVFSLHLVYVVVLHSTDYGE